MKQFKVPVMITMLVVLITAMAISGCTSPTPTASPTAAPSATPAPGPTVLTVDGKVNTSLSLSLNDLESYTQYTASWVNNAGNNSYNGTGLRLLDLLNKAGLQAGATNLTFTGSDNYTSTMTLANLESIYNDTIVAWDWSGKDKSGNTVTNVNNTLQLIVPNGGGKDQAKLLVKITVS